jgi:tetratricopeptide (TPR) repeat protein
MAKKKKTTSAKQIPTAATLSSSAWYNQSKWASWLIFLVSFLIYANTLGHEYTQDDAIVIYDNEFTTQGISGIPDILRYDTFRGFFKVEGKDKLVAGGRYRPLTLVMFAIEWELFGNNPFMGHLISILLYGFTAVLLYWLLLSLFKNYKKELPVGLFVLGAALLFTVHPVHTEVVANIKGRDETMALMGSLGALLLLLKGIDTASLKWKLLGVTVFFLALFSKENTITFLAIIPLSLWFFRKQSPVKAIGETLPFLAAALVFLVIRGSIIGWTLGDPPMELMNNPFVKLEGNAFVPFAFGEWLATVIFTLGKYLLVLIFPYPLTHDYYPRHIEIMEFSDWQVILSMLVYLGLGVFALLKIGKRNVLAYSILFYLISLSIVSNLFFPVGTNMSERFLFMPSVGFAIALSYLFTYFEKGKGNSLIKYGVLVFVVLFSGKTILRNTAWKDNFTLFTTDVHTSKRSAKLQNAVGGELISQSSKVNDAGKKNQMLQEAIQHLDVALEIHPNYKNAWLLKGNAYNYLKEYEAAVTSYENALRIDPNYPEAHNNLKITYRDAGRYYGEEKGNVQKALEYLQKAYEKDQNDFESIRLLGVANGIIQNHEAAIRFFTKAVEMQPENADLLFNLGSAYYNAGNAEEGQRWHTRARQIDPNAGQPK